MLSHGRAAVVLIIGALAVLLARTSAHTKQSQVSWMKDVAPIIDRRCAGCHVAGGFGRIPLTTYQQAKSWAPQISQDVLERRMPPWLGASGFGDFSNDLRLSPVEVEIVNAWATGGTPLGLSSVEGGSLGPAATRRPDLVIGIPAGVRSGSVERFELTPDLRADRWMTGWEFLPGNRAIVERATLSDVEGHVSTWAPPDRAVMLPPGVAQRLSAGTRLVVDLRLRKSVEPDATGHRVALYFGSAPRRELRHLPLTCGSTVLARDIDALAVEASASEAGESVEVVARHPDGSVDPLCVVPRFLPGYAAAFRLRNALPLNRGTVIDVRSSAPQCHAELDFIDSVTSGRR